MNPVYEFNGGSDYALNYSDHWQWKQTLQELLAR